MEQTRRRRPDPFGLSALVASGTLAAHELGYLVGEAGAVSHTYIGVIAPIVLLGGCIAAWFAALRILRHDAGALPSVNVLAALQVVVYLVMEIGERLASGSLDSFVSLPVAVGLGLQPLVAFVAARLLSVGRRIVEAFRPASVRRAVRRLVNALVPVFAPVSNPQFARLRLRGPPV